MDPLLRVYRSASQPTVVKLEVTLPPEFMNLTTDKPALRIGSGVQVVASGVGCGDGEGPYARLVWDCATDAHFQKVQKIVEESGLRQSAIKFGVPYSTRSSDTAATLAEIQMTPQLQTLVLAVREVCGIKPDGDPWLCVVINEWNHCAVSHAHEESVCLRFSLCGILVAPFVALLISRIYSIPLFG